jgi:Chemotaxis protein histidine kinase and related kinases
MATDILAALQHKFLERCRQDRSDLSALMQRAELASPEARRIIHGLAGAAGSFGFAGLSEAAALADEPYSSGQCPTEAMVQRVLDQLDTVLMPSSD